MRPNRLIVVRCLVVVAFIAVLVVLWAPRPSVRPSELRYDGNGSGHAWAYLEVQEFGILGYVKVERTLGWVGSWNVAPGAAPWVAPPPTVVTWSKSDLRATIVATAVVLAIFGCWAHHRVNSRRKPRTDDWVRPTPAVG